MATADVGTVETESKSEAVLTNHEPKRLQMDLSDLSNRTVIRGWKAVDPNYFDNGWQ